MRTLLSASLLLASIAAVAAPVKSLTLDEAEIRAAAVESEALGKSTAIPLTLAGRVVARNGDVVVVPAPAAGLVRRLFGNVPDTVSTGAELALLYSPQAAVEARDFIEAASASDLAEVTARRDAELVDKGLVPGRRALESAAAARQAAARERAARAALRMLGIRDAAADRLYRSGVVDATVTVRADVGGTITEQMVSAGDRVEVGAPLFRIVRPGPRWLDLQATLDQAAHLRAGAAVHVEGCSAVGRVVALSTVVNAASQSVLVRAAFPATPACLMPEQYVQAQVAVTSSSSVPPAAAVFRYEGSEHVFLRDGRHFTAVTLDDDRLRPGVQVVTRGVVTLKAALEGAAP